MRKGDAKNLQTMSYQDQEYRWHMETMPSGGEKQGIDKISDSPPLTPSKGAHSIKMIKQNPTTTDVLEAIQALHSRFVTKKTLLDTKLTQNAVMIANLTKSINFNSEGVKECKEKIVLETQVFILQKEVDELLEGT